MEFPLPNISADLRGKTAIVTGASSGLGLRFAQVLASCGAQVALAARRADRLQTAVEEVRQAGGVAEAFPVDLTDADQVTDLVPRVEAQFGLVSILVNNAAAMVIEPAVSASVAGMDEQWRTNVRAPYILCREVGRRLIERGLPGRIVNIASESALDYIGGGWTFYAITKRALIRVTETLAVEWAKTSVNINAIAPGTLATEMIEQNVARFGDFSSRFPRRRFGNVAHLDGALLFLVSDASDFITGACIRADDAQHHR